MSCVWDNLVIASVKTPFLHADINTKLVVAHEPWSHDGAAVCAPSCMQFSHGRFSAKI